MLVYGDMTSCTDCHIVDHSAAVLYSNSYYTVVASIFLVSAASCKAICGVASVRTSDYRIPHYLCYTFNYAKSCDHVYNIVVKPLEKTWLWWASGLHIGLTTARYRV